jgi:hypothetical protein
MILHKLTAAFAALLLVAVPAQGAREAEAIKVN